MAGFGFARWPPGVTSLSLGLQGGGAHGAFTWGVLDALLEQRVARIEAASGTSAGAVNATVLAHGWLEGEADGARAALNRFWTELGAKLPFDWWMVSGDEQEPHLTPLGRVALHLTTYVSPYQFNPLALNPLRELLLAHVDFERLRRASPMQLLIAATHVATGRLRVFRMPEISVDVVLASACLPTLHHAVQIDGEAYWDGGYSANPAIFPLLEPGLPTDVMIVMLSPLEQAAVPRTAQEIQDRAREISFNATFLREAALLGDIRAMAERSLLPLGRLERRVRRARFHLIEAQQHLGQLRTETKLITHQPFLHHLMEQGRACATRWLTRHGSALGRRSTVDLQGTFAPPASVR